MDMEEKLEPTKISKEAKDMKEFFSDL